MIKLNLQMHLVNQPNTKAYITQKKVKFKLNLKSSLKMKWKKNEENSDKKNT